MNFLLDHGADVNACTWVSHKSIKLPGILRKTKAQNIAFLNHVVFGCENEHFFLRHIVWFIPRTRFEEGEGEKEAEQEELLRQEEVEQSHATIAQAHLKQLQDLHEQVEAQQVNGSPRCSGAGLGFAADGRFSCLKR